MTSFLGLLLILAIAFIGSKFFSRTTVINNPVFSGLIVSGFPYILMGVLLGPHFFNFLSSEIISSLEPLISLALGWIGLLFGIQLRWRNIRRFPVNYLIFSSLQSLISFVIIFAIILISFSFLSPAKFVYRLEAAFILAAIGSTTAPLTLGRLVIEHKAKGKLTHFIQFISSLDDIWGITIAGIAMAVFHPTALQWFTAGWQWIALSVLISIALGLIFQYLIKFRFQQQEVLLLVLGLVIFTSGIGFYLRLSPIFMNMIVGITLAQFHRESEKVMRVLPLVEKPIYLLLLVFAGSLWNYQFIMEILLLITFIVARFVGKYVGGWIGSQNIECGFQIPQDIGKALLSFGGVALAIAFNFQLFYGGLMGDLILSATILAILVFDEYTHTSTLKILKRQGDVK
jgi:hypothetical protein